MLPSVEPVFDTPATAPLITDPADLSAFRREAFAAINEQPARVRAFFTYIKRLPPGLEKEMAFRLMNLEHDLSEETLLYFFSERDVLEVISGYAQQFKTGPVTLTRAERATSGRTGQPAEAPQHLAGASTPDDAVTPVRQGRSR